MGLTRSPCPRSMGSVSHRVDCDAGVVRRAVSFARLHTQHVGSAGVWVNECGWALRTLPVASGRSVPGGPELDGAGHWSGGSSTGGSPGS